VNLPRFFHELAPLANAGQPISLHFNKKQTMQTKKQLLVCTVLLSFWFHVICLPQHLGAQGSAAKVFAGAPIINAPFITGNYANTPFLFAIPTSGKRPIKWLAKKLPAGLRLNAATGIITGNIAEAGKYVVDVAAENSLGRASQKLTIVIGDTLCLTPPMGWNSWNTFTNTLNEQLVKEMADKMVSSGMRELGYQYINLDDFWQLPQRDAEGNIQINREKFPNGIKAVADYVHARGLKLGIYSDAADKTCGGVAGGYGYEERDAADYAKWGVDLLKYDYCHAPSSVDTAKKRYDAMAKALRKTNRSIVLSVCEWGERKPWEWASAIGGTYWRTTGDINDKWDKPVEHESVMEIVDQNLPLAPYAGPGHWNDPDMLVVGIYGKGKATLANTAGGGCTDTEYRSHMSLWCMMASPLICGNDLRTMNLPTTSTLMNKEMIGINQDVLGKQATVFKTENDVQMLVKPLSGKAWAIAFFNRGKTAATATLALAELGIASKAAVRDVWQQKNIASSGGTIKATVPPHGCEVFMVRENGAMN
jgi:alpha-galactosidase